jgi:hypothetical protein
MSLDWTKLVGRWYNQLGSWMILNPPRPDGGLDGIYHSAVGKAVYEYVLTGRFDASPPRGRGISVGWVVTYRNDRLNAHSTATWSGQYFDDSAGEKILTHWLLTRSTQTENVWESTNLGTDTFTRNQPTDAEIAKARALTICSPHVEDILAAMNLTADP